MSKKKKRTSGASDAATAAAPSSDALSSSDGAIISKTQKRKLQKKRAKEAAKIERDAAAAKRAEEKAARLAQAQERASEPHPTPQPLAFAADEDDHCETAPEAYGHVASLLRQTATALGIHPVESLRIYDPYYCNGAVVRHLQALGFPNVYNANEDCYATWSSGNVPPHDVVLTNPPYSGDHPERLLDFLAANGKPWLALMPNWVCTREYFAKSEAAGGGERVCYLAPIKRYNYWTPRGRRSDVAAGGAKAKTHGHTNAALGVRTSPFVSFWYLGGFPSAVRTALRDAPPEGCRVFGRREELPHALLRDA